MPFLSSHFRSILTIVSFSLVLTSFSVVSYGQDETSNLEIEEIIVTAQKREESLQDVPIAITAITEQLGDATIRNIAFNFTLAFSPPAGFIT